ncbi:MAG: lamin tail domain-containing protein [Bacteroidales bacterium]
MARKNLENIGISVILNFLLITPLFAQFTDNFADGNITSNPLWIGDTNKFEVNTQDQLHLKSTGTDSSFICTESALLDSTEWVFWTKLSFSPSANNYCRIYLCSDSSRLIQATQAVYLQMGEAGSSDALELFRVDGVQHYSICRGKEAFIASSFSVRIKVTRDLSGKWTISADSLGGNAFLEQASGYDNSLLNVEYFGIYCKYTSSNSTKFYFDDFIVRNIEQDLSPPKLTRLRVEDEYHLGLTFTEALEPSLINNILNYQVDQGIGRPEAVLFSLSDLSNIQLTFSAPFQQTKSYYLHITQLSDLSGNIIEDTLVAFTCYRPGSYDIVINEILADPDPQVGLPPVEYIELYNATAYSIDLDNWILKTSSSQRTIPPFTLAPGEYVVLADSLAGMLFMAYGNFLGIQSLSLANDGSMLCLLNDAQQLIHSVSYTSDWYADDLKSEGGWSLEQIDPLNPCAGKSNWRASRSNLGGTPAYVNSVFAENPDITEPFPLRIGVTDPRNITVYFSEPIDTASFHGVTSFLIQPGALFPDQVSFRQPDYSSLKMKLPASMEPGIIYTLKFQDTMTDCAGNILRNSVSLLFGLPGDPDSSDVVINEILYNPETGVPEFFEIYNVSDKIIRLNDFLLAETDSITHEITDKFLLSTDSRLLFPGEYLAFTPGPEELCNNYRTDNPQGIFHMEPFPVFVNSGGCLSLTDRNEKIIDRLIYSENMQYPLLNSTRGVSLERINAKASGEDRSNWHSASSSCGYATPAMKNSQSSESFITDEDIVIEPRIFSPDNDGYHDVLSVHCNMNEPGYLANIVVYNTSGQLIRTIANKKLLGLEDTFYWDGINNKGYKSPVGMYILFFEFFNAKGTVNHRKKVIVLGERI